MFRNIFKYNKEHEATKKLFIKYSYTKMHEK